MPGPTGLDRRPTSIHGVSRGPATLTYHPQRAHAARLAAEKACGHTGACVKKRCSRWAQRAGFAQGTVPRALPASAATIGGFSRQPEAPACHLQRGRPASTGRGRRHFPAKKRRWPAAMTPRVGRLRADDRVASHRAADGGGPSIEAARTHGRGTSRGAVGGLRAFGPPRLRVRLSEQ